MHNFCFCLECYKTTSQYFTGTQLTYYCSKFNWAFGYKYNLQVPSFAFTKNINNLTITCNGNGYVQTNSYIFRKLKATFVTTKKEKSGGRLLGVGRVFGWPSGLPGTLTMTRYHLIWLSMGCKYLNTMYAVLGKAKTKDYRAWARAVWSSEVIVGHFFKFTIVKVKGPNKLLNDILCSF